MSRRINEEIERIWTRTKINETIEQIDKKRDRAFLSFLYLTAGRISEVLASRKIDISEFVRSEVVFVKVFLKNEKSKDFPSKDIPFPKDDPLVKNLVDYISSLHGNDRLFKFTRMHGWRLVKKYTSLWCHAFRHFRLTELAVVYDFDAIDLMKIAGWTDTRPAAIYIRKKFTHLADKMTRMMKPVP